MRPTSSGVSILAIENLQRFFGARCNLEMVRRPPVSECFPDQVGLGLTVFNEKNFKYHGPPPQAQCKQHVGTFEMVKTGDFERVFIEDNTSIAWTTIPSQLPNGSLFAPVGRACGGIHRANVATGMLKKAGFIRYVRGKLMIIDRPGLESSSCDCYHAIVKVYNHLIPNAQEPAS